MEWILGIGLMFGLAFVLTFMTRKDMLSFLAWLTVFCGIVVWAGLLELWTLILCIIFLVLILYLDVKGGKEVG